MRPLLSSPGFLLPAVGIVLGLNFPLGKLATAAGIAAPVWAFVISAGAALGLALFLLAHGGGDGARRLERASLRYFALVALISYVVPNLLLLATIPRLGSGLTAVFFALSPMVTVVFSRFAGLRRPAVAEYLGIFIGVGGALLVASARGEIGRPAEWSAVALGLLIPVFLASGNVYRSLDWPKGADPTWLAFGSNAASALINLAVALALGGPAGFAGLIAVPGLVLAQAAASTAMFLLFFRLQRHGGPVTLSQIGTVAAGFGVAVGAGFLGERYPPSVWFGCLLILAGLALTIRARRREG